MAEPTHLQTDGTTTRNQAGPGRWVPFAILVVALCLRVAGLGAHGLWLDEFTSLCNAHGFIKDMPLTADLAAFRPADVWAKNTMSDLIAASVFADGGNGILYYLLLHLWTSVAGVSDVMVRLPSALLGTIIVGLTYGVARQTLGTRVATWAGALAACHPFLIRYSQEARAYSLATCFALVAFWCAVRLLRERDRPQGRIGVGLMMGSAAGLALLSHYLSVAVVTAIAVALITSTRRSAVWRPLVIGIATTLLLVGVWYGIGGSQGLTIIEQRSHAYQDRLVHPLPNESAIFPATPRYLVAGVLQVVYALSGNSLQQAPMPVARLVWWLPVVGLLIGLAFRRAGKDAPGAIGMIAMAAVSSLLLATCLALRAGHILSFQTPYSLFATPYVVILMAAGLAKLWERPARAILPSLVTAGVLAWSVMLVYTDAPLHRPPNPWKKAAADIAAQAGHNDTVVFAAWPDAYLCSLYLPKALTIAERVTPQAPAHAIQLLHGSQTLATWTMPAL